ncbi:MAG: hypothetical protein KGM44_07020 [bacterium]|nr:hypothetical protein [bacterium]
MGPVTGVRAECALDTRQRDAFADLCARGGGALRAWRPAPAFQTTFAVFEGAIDEREAAGLLHCAVHTERPPALYLGVESSEAQVLQRLKEALSGPGGPVGITVERHDLALLVRIATRRTPFSVVRDLIDLEAGSSRAGCRVTVLSPIDLETLVLIASEGLGVPLRTRDVLEARL